MSKYGKFSVYDKNGKEIKLFTLPHLFLLDSYWTPGLLLDFTRTPANFILADHHTNLVSHGVQYKESSRNPVGIQ